MSGPSPHFTWHELDADGSTCEQRVALALLCWMVLEPLRVVVGRPVRVISAYRTRAANDALPNAAPDSQHLRGEAVDVVVDGLTSAELARTLLDAGIPYDQLIWYDADRHVHVSWSATRRRGEVLHATEAGYPREWPP